VKPTAQQKLAPTIVMVTENAFKVLANVRPDSWENCAMCVDAQPIVLDTESVIMALANATKAGREMIALQKCALLSATTTEYAPRMGHANVSLVTRVLPVPQKHARPMI